LIYSWKWIWVLGTGLIEAGVVDGHPKLSVCLGDDDWIGQPHWVMDLFDEASVQRFPDLLTDEVLPLNGLSPRLLTHWPGIRVDLQMVLDHLLGDPRHLRWFPCEHVGIRLEEGDEREFLFFLQVTRDASGLGGIRAELDGLGGDAVCPRWLHLRHLGRRLGTGSRGVPSPVIRASSFCRQGVQLLNGGERSRAVASHGKDPNRGRHLEDQIPIMGNGHEPVQGRPANDGIKREVNLCNVELDVLCAEVFLVPECNWECDAPKGIHWLWAHSGEWTRGSQSGPLDLQLLECNMADDVEPSPTVNQNMVQPHVGDDRGGDER
jgi:hypothetical protein